MSDVLIDTLALWRRTSHVYGQSDCLISVGEYIVRCGYPDVVTQFKGTYHDEAGAALLMDAFGGPAGLIDLTGLPRIEPVQAARSDVVVFGLGASLIGGLCTGKSVAARLEKGVIEINRHLLNILHAWKI